jgi:ATP/maltotriose-dependent transcriptional regulator MalT
LAWLSLDAHDSQPLTSVRYLAATLETLYPDGCRETLSLTEAHFQPSFTRLTDTLLSEIAKYALRPDRGA